MKIIMQADGITNILIAGVGGQGIILSSEVLAATCLAAGFDVKQSEVHGMAQRGGSVTSHVRFGKKVYSPTIERGTADILLAFEMLEGIRWLGWLRAGGRALINRQRIDPITVAGGLASYPGDIEQTVLTNGVHPVFIDGPGIAKKAGAIKAVNVALLGALSSCLEIPMELWEAGIKNRVPPKTIDINLTAFHEGRKTVHHPSPV